MKRIVLSILLALTVTASLAQQPVRFHSYMATRDWKLDVGPYLSMDSAGDSAIEWSVLYTRNFFGGLAFRTGVQYVGGMFGYNYNIGVPLALSYRPGTESLVSSLIGAAEMTVMDVVYDGVYGHSSDIFGDILWNFAAAIFRRNEYFIGITPGVWGGTSRRDTADGFYDYDDPEPSALSLTVDVGMVFCIPIRHIGINFTPTFHYALTNNAYTEDYDPARIFGSFTVGLSYMF